MQSHQGSEILTFILVIAAVVAFKGGIGYLIGKHKGRGTLGFILGLLLGCLGWIIIACLSAEAVAPLRPLKLCRECRRQIPKTSRACPSCGALQGTSRPAAGGSGAAAAAKPRPSLRRPPLR